MIDRSDNRSLSQTNRYQHLCLRYEILNFTESKIKERFTFLFFSFIYRIGVFYFGNRPKTVDRKWLFDSLQFNITINMNKDITYIQNCWCGRWCILGTASQLCSNIEETCETALHQYSLMNNESLHYREELPAHHRLYLHFKSGPSLWFTPFLPGALFTSLSCAFITRPRSHL